MSQTVFTFPENEARLFNVEENSYLITFFDVIAVAEYNNTDMVTAVEKIAESHNIDFDNIEIVYEAEANVTVSGLGLGAAETHLKRLEKDIEDTKEGIAAHGISNDNKITLEKKLKRLESNLSDFKNRFKEAKRRQEFLDKHK